ncbi:MAG: hypothetical protein Q8S84_08895 [bacterium]|nr:hypothetical protein [bacterium]
MLGKGIVFTNSAIGGLELIYIIFESVSVSHDSSVTFIFTLYFHFSLNVYENNVPDFLNITASLSKSISSQA